MRRPWGGGLLCLLLVASTGTARAHEVGGTRFDAPIPLWLLLAGAGATVAVTAAWLAASGGPSPSALRSRRLATIPRLVGRSIALVGRGAFLALFLLAVVLGLSGPHVAAENVATVFVWSVWLKGVGILAASIGDPWRVLSPWRTVYTALVRLEGEPIAIVGSYPSWLREWPALLGFVVWVGVLENLTVVPRSPRETTLWIVTYATVMLLGAIAFGDEWIERADTLAVLYRLFGRVAPVAIDRGSEGAYSISVRAPWNDCTRPVRDLVVVGFVVATVYTVSFDGFTSTPEYQTILFATRDVVPLGPSSGVLLYVVGYLSFLGTFAVVVGIADAVGGRTSSHRALLAVAPTVVPIAVAYEIAHTYPYVARNVGQLAFVLGRHVGVQLAPVDLLGWLSLPLFWGSQVLLVVGGHVVAVVAVHHVTYDRYPTRRWATRALLPLTGVMVAYTVLSLWIISRPVVA